MEKSRIKNSVRNAKSALMMQLINKILAFIVRTVFIKVLNTEYLGVNGLFTNILSILSFAELGIGTAIIFSMYKPVAEENKEKIKSLMYLYKKTYTAIGFIVFFLGLLVTPFLKYMISDISYIKENIIFIYILFLFNTSFSYFYSYKKSIITVYQQESIINKIISNFYVLKSILEIIVLFLFKNYILYLVIEISCTICQNIYLSFRANKMFPFLMDKDIILLEKKELKDIVNNVKSLIVYKFGGIILNGTDNIIMSVMVNVSTVGLCSNYTLIINSLKSIVTAVQDSITASVGNLNSVENKDKQEKIFYQLDFLNFWIYLLLSIMFIFLLNPLIKIWLGKKFILSTGIVIALSISFFIEGLRITAYIYRVTLGLFIKGKITPYLASIINIISSIVLCKYFGVIGIFIGTSLAQLFSYSWIDPYIIYKYTFKTSILPYVKKHFFYVISFIIIFIIIYIFNFYIPNSNFVLLLIKGCLYFIIINFILIILFRKSYEFVELKKRLISLIKVKCSKGEK